MKQYCQLCGIRDAPGLRKYEKCSHTVCSKCAQARTVKSILCGHCAFEEDVKDFEHLVLLLPRPRDREARSIVVRYCDRAKMLARHHIPPTGGSDISQGFALRRGQLDTLERDADASDFRVARYVHPTRRAACYVMLDATESVYAMCFGGARSRVFDMDAWPSALRRIMGALTNDFVRLAPDGAGRTEKTSWLAVSCDAVSYTDWKMAFREELLNNGSTNLRYVSYRAVDFVADALRRWASDGHPKQLTAPGNQPSMPSTSLHVPIKSANGTWSARSWPSELRVLAEKLLSTRVILSAVLADTEDAWVRPTAPTSPGAGTCVIANRGGHVDVSNQWFSDVPPGDTEALNYPLVHIYVALCISGLRTSAAKEIAQRLGLKQGQYAVVEEAAILGAILSAWGATQGTGSHASLGWGADRVIHRAWFAADAWMPMIFETMRLSACMRALRLVENNVIERGSVDGAYAKA